MRIYTNVFEAFRETERDVAEMGIRVHPQTMQDKRVVNNEDFSTLELQGYGFKLDVPAGQLESQIAEGLGYFSETPNVLEYIRAEIIDRTSFKATNPGNSWFTRPEVWNEFLHDGKFAYTYSERIAPQLEGILHELRERPSTRQAIVNIHSNIAPHHDTVHGNKVDTSADFNGMGGNHRIPCSMYYQFLRRPTRNLSRHPEEGGGPDRLDIIYTMRSCDLLTHFPVDIALALMLNQYMAKQLQLTPGTLTYFAGSLHAYKKDMARRKAF